MINQAKKQTEKLDKPFLIMSWIIIGFSLFETIILNYEHSIQRIPSIISIIQIISFGLIGGLLYFRNVKSVYFRNTMITGMYLTQIINLFFSSSETAYIFLYPAIILSMMYLEISFTVAPLLYLNVLTGIWLFVNRSNPRIAHNTFGIVLMTLELTLTIIITTLIAGRKKKEAAEAAKKNLQNTEQQNKMIKDMINVMNIINDKTVNVTNVIEIIDSMSKNLQTSIEEISRGAANTAENIQNQTVATNEIENKINATAEISKLVRSSAITNEEKVESGMNISKQLLEKSIIVKKKDADVYKVVNKLKDATADIQNITEIISGIADQTNLLALNANIEAARAGEAGKGFAVVANEVKTLAEESKNSSVNISNIINKLEHEVAKSIEAVTEISKINEEQNELINKTNDILNTVKLNSIDVKEKVGMIDDSIKEVLKSETEIAESISSISAISEETMATTEETAAITAEYAEQTSKARQSMEELLQTAEIMKKYR